MTVPAHILPITPMSDKPLPPYTRESIAEAIDKHEREREWAAAQVYAGQEAIKCGAPRELVDMLMVDGAAQVITWVELYVLALGRRSV